MTHTATPAARAQAPCGLNHLVINVRNLEAAHRFWTECLGFRQVGTFRRPGPDGQPRAIMRFYSGERDGKLTHHDIALLEEPALPAGMPQALHHVAISYPDRDAWEAQIRFLLARGVPMKRRVERGATCSLHLEDPDGNEIELVYELPRSLWEDDIEGALNRAVERPITG